MPMVPHSSQQTLSRVFSCLTPLFPSSFFSQGTTWELRDRDVLSFLSFEDALVFLFDVLGVGRDDTVLLPGFYCEDVTANIAKRCKVQHYAIDEDRLDADVSDFRDQLKTAQPRVVFLYNVFGKETELHERTEWLQDLRDDAIVISDMAHSLLPFHALNALMPRHFFIDSARKCTPCMVAHLVCPPGFTPPSQGASPWRWYPVRARVLFGLIALCMRLHVVTTVRSFARIADVLFILHNGMIGETNVACRSFAVDERRYRRLHFDRIAKIREQLWAVYDRTFATLDTTHVRRFILNPKSVREMCYYCLAIPPDAVPGFLKYMEDNRVIADQLWDMDRIPGLTPRMHQLGSSIVVFPLTPDMTEGDAQTIAVIASDYLDATLP